jgi:hypothetical protein
MLDDEAIQFCLNLFDQTPTHATRLGGNSRDSVRVNLPNGSVIATKRKNSSRADLEAIVLRELNFGGAAVPKLLHYGDNWLIQEDLGDIRLSMALAKSNDQTGKNLLLKCIEGIAEIHLVGTERHLEHHLPQLGVQDEWLLKFIKTPERLGSFLDLPTPSLDTAKLIEDLKFQTRSFVKWDNRPGNIIISKQGYPKWIDWEHCGVRNALDDFAWLLGDEYVPDWIDAEDTLLTAALNTLENGINTLEAHSYLMVFGTFHMSQRLSLILSKKDDGPWWDTSECITNDRVGVFHVAAKRICSKASRWAKKNEHTAPLSAWFEKLSKLI